MNCKDCEYCNETEESTDTQKFFTCWHKMRTAGYENTEGWGIFVGPMFGCIHFKERKA